MHLLEQRGLCLQDDTYFLQETEDSRSIAVTASAFASAGNALQVSHSFTSHHSSASSARYRRLAFAGCRKTHSSGICGSDWCQSSSARSNSGGATLGMSPGSSAKCWPARSRERLASFTSPARHTCPLVSQAAVGGLKAIRQMCTEEPGHDLRPPPQATARTASGAGPRDSALSTCQATLRARPAKHKPSNCQILARCSATAR